MIKKFLKIVNKKFKLGKRVKIKYVSDRPGHDLRYAISSKKIRKHLNWKTNLSLNEGMLKTFEWYYSNQKYYSSLSKKDIVKRLGKKI